MAKKYNFSVTYPVSEGFQETLQVVDCDSFDEAIKIVERAAKDRFETLSAKIKEVKTPIPGSARHTIPPTVPPGQQPGQSGPQNETGE